MITGDRIDAIFEEMNGYVLALASEPGALGPQYFQDIIAKCRGYLNNVSLVISELNHEKLFESSELRKLEATYALDYDNLLANDPAVRSLANIEDRKSTVGFLLRAQRIEINEGKDRLHSLDSVYKVVAHRSRELHATMNAIKDQRRLMVTELSTGSFYGDERTSRRRSSDPASSLPMEDISAEDLAAMMSEPAAGETVEASPVQKEVQSEPSAEPDLDLPAPSEAKEPDLQIALESPLEAAQTPTEVRSHGPHTATEEEVLAFIETGNDGLPQAVVPAPEAATPLEDDFMSVLNDL